jgi:hypothetical protein
MFPSVDSMVPEVPGMGGDEAKEGEGEKAAEKK